MTTREIVSAIGKAVLKPLAQPRGTKLQIYEAYFERFSDQQINLFLEKLKKSEWVNNDSFSLDNLVKRDLVNVLLSGSRKALNVSKHYNPIVIAGPRDSTAIPLGVCALDNNCKQCGNILSRVYVLFPDRTITEELCQKCNADKYQTHIATNAKIISKRMRNGFVPERYFNAVLRQQDTPIDAIPAVCRHDSGVFIFGESGSGKSAALAGWMRVMLSYGNPCLWLNWSDEACMLHADQKYFPTLLNKLDGKLLFIDDFDTTDKFLSVYIYNLVDRLYRNKCQVFYTANALPDSEKLAMRIGHTTIQVEYTGVC